MSKKYDKLKALLKELFQLDHPDLDFGLYRIMHAKSAEITQFLDRDLLPQVREEFAQYKTADKSDLEAQLAKAIEQAQQLGADPESLPKVKELRAKYDRDSVDIAGLESEVYDHLYGFFRRYYSEGDFLSKRVYKPGVYAIPYEGEEVKLHWANADQYYIKTSEYLRDYAFRLHPDDEQNPMRVHFRLVDAAEGEHGNVKAAEGKDRVFILASKDFAVIEPGEQGPELALEFEYRPATLTDWPDDVRTGKKKPPTQKEMTELAVSRVMEVEGDLANWITELGKPHIKADGEQADYSRLRAHLNRYVARNTFDYFIHKDLGTFLRRELDFYIKNEVMHLDDIENDTVPRVEQYLSKVRIIRRIATKIITFLAHLEDFQKKLWLKKKFVVETNYCIAVGSIPEEFYAEIAANDAQRQEWVDLLAINEIQKDLTGPGYTEPLTTDFLAANPLVMVDTKHFDEGFKCRVLEVVLNTCQDLDGIVIHGDNFSALHMISRRFTRAFDLVYIDPPYNTGNDGFVYRDQYQRSSWLSMIHDRIRLTRDMLSEHAGFCVSIDDNENSRLRFALDQALGADSFVAEIVWQKRYAPDIRKAISDAHEYLMLYSPNPSMFKASRNLLPLTDAQTSQFRNPDNDPRGPWKADNFTAPGYRPNQMYEITTPAGRIVTPPAGRCWGVTEENFKRLRSEERMYYGTDGSGLPSVKRFLSDMEGMVPWTWWNHEEVGHSQDGLKGLIRLFGREHGFLTAKPVSLIEKLCRIATNKHSMVLDYFAGSGTTAHAVFALNRADGGKRKFVLAEVGSCFNTILLPRIKKVAYTPNWRDGHPESTPSLTEISHGPTILKYIRLESYEDTLNNLQLRRSKTQQTLLDSAQNTEASRLKEQYMLGYMLNVETEGSQSLLNVQAFTDPTAYKLKVKRPGSDETREVNVDLLETFNWLIGLTVQHIAAPQRFSAKFERDSESRLQLKGRLKQDDEGSYWFRTVTTPDGRKTLIIWRKRPGGETPEGVEQDNLVLDEWFTKQGYSSKDSEFGLIYVNGTNNLENLRTPEDLWKVRLIEEDFHRLMFAAEGV